MSAAATATATTATDDLSLHGYGRGADILNDGYRGHLSTTQQQIYDQFIAAMPAIEQKAKEAHLSAAPSDAAKFEKPPAYTKGPHYQEYTALRFLRARKFDLKAATEMYTKHMAWRYQYDVDHILCSDAKVPKQALVDKLVPSVAHGYDKQGRPVFFSRPGKVDTKTVCALVSEKEYLANHIARMENHLRYAAEASAKTGRYIETFTFVLDLTGAKLAGGNTGYTNVCVENDAINYPECLGQLIIINAPWVFPALWKLVSPFVDKRTKAKITIVYGSYDAALRTVMTEDQIPVCYGGRCEAHSAQVGGCCPETDMKDLKLSDMAGDGSGAADQAELKEITIAAGKRHEEKLTVNKGAVVHWYFRLENVDVAFSVTAQSAEGKTDIIQAPVRTHTHQGSYHATGSGTVTILFDNHHSYFKSKTVRYSIINVEPTGDAEQDEPETVEALTQETPRFVDDN